MKNYTRHLVALLFLCYMTPAVGLDMKTLARDYFQIKSVGENNTTYSYDVLETNLPNLPKWDGTGKPPLSMENAIELSLGRAKEEANSEIATVEEALLDSKIGKCSEANCKIDFWYYIIRVKTVPRHIKVDRSMIKRYLVLMDGSFGLVSDLKKLRSKKSSGS